jgi:hypothetical protein
MDHTIVGLRWRSYHSYNNIHDTRIDHYREHLLDDFLRHLRCHLLHRIVVPFVSMVYEGLEANAFKKPLAFGAFRGFFYFFAAALPGRPFILIHWVLTVIILTSLPDREDRFSE